MPRRCTVCDHARRGAIDQVLVERSASYRDVATRYRLTKDALYRHYAEHLPPALAKAQAAAEAANADDLLGRLLELNRITLEILTEARAGKENALALQAIGRAEKQIELQGRLLGELKDTTVNVLVTHEWQEIQRAILRTLAPYPDVRVRVADAIASLAQGNGRAARP